MAIRIFGEHGSRKRKIWYGVAAFFALVITFEVGYRAGVHSMADVVERLATVPQHHPVAHSQRASERMALPPVPSFSSVLPLTTNGTAISVRPAEPCLCGKVH